MADPELSIEEQYARAKAADQAPSADTSNPYVGIPGYVDRPPPQAPQPTPQKPYTGQVLPVSVNEKGESRFDPYAGILGGFTRPIKFVGDVASGRIPADTSNPEYIGGAADMALNYGPGAVASRVGPGAVKAPSQAHVFEKGSQAFEDFRASSQIFPGSGYRGFLKTSMDDLNAAGRYNIPEGATHAHTALAREADRVKNYPFVMADDISKLKTQLDASGQQGMNLAGTMQAREGLYNYLEGLGDTNLKKGVDNWRQASHSEQITGKDTAKGLKNVAKGEGDALSAKQSRDTIADTLIAIEQGKKAGRGFTGAEEAVLKDSLYGSRSTDIAQKIGDKLDKVGGGTAGGVGFTGAVAALASGHPGVAASIIGASTAPALGGWAARSYANRGARLASEEANNYILGRSPAAAETFKGAPPLHTGFLAPGAAGQSRSGYGEMMGPMVSDAVNSYFRDKLTPQAPPVRRILPDGTIEDLS